jgi:hypothetical protein
VATDWYDGASAALQVCPGCLAVRHCAGGIPFCECPCTAGQPGDPVPLARAMAELADRMTARSRAQQAAAAAAHDQLAAGFRVRESQLACRRCVGDLDADIPAVEWAAQIGTGECTCELRCARRHCLATENGWMP